VSSRIDSHTKKEASTSIRFQEKREKELEKQREEVFNQYKTMVQQGKEWRVKISFEPAPVRLVEESVRPVTPVRPMTQRCCPVFLLLFPWFVMTSPHRILHQKTMRSLLTTVLHQSA
jgi:hypothetical protein